MTRYPNTIRIPLRRNPGPSEDAVDKFREFNRFDPRWVGEFGVEMQIPASMRRLGDAKAVMYRSGKVDPETMRKPRRPQNYIHEHDAGVEACVVVGGGLDLPEHEVIEVPGWLLEVDSLVLLGDCLGFSFDAGDGEVEVIGDSPLPELYCTPCGKALVVVQDKTRLEALIWGGALGVEGRGIVG